MMNREVFLKNFEFTEELYRELYRSNPQAFAEPVKNWKEFCGRFEAEDVKKRLPAEPPTVMGELLCENEYFLVLGSLQQSGV